MAKTSKPSDSGGVAARKGFEYQDHIAASFLIEMLSGTIVQVECERTDDITVVWKDITEYIQVKTSEGDYKWTIKELCALTPKNSIYTTSFSYDNIPGQDILFRIVTTRDITKNLSLLSQARDNRSDTTAVNKLAKSIFSASKKFKSPVGNDATYWVMKTLWDIPGKLLSVEVTNKKKLLQLAEKFGVNLSSTDSDKIYDDIVLKAYKAGNASKVTEPKMKIIEFNELNTWWKNKINDLTIAATGNSKPYKNRVDPFLIEFHSMTQKDLRKAINALEAGFENKNWRNEGLAKHMVDWLPEIALKASEVAVLNHTNFLKYSEKARKAIKKHIKNAGEELISEILLHICLRQTFNSEPIACKVFYLSKDQKSKSFPNAHIIHLNGADELWLGKSAIVYLDDFSESIKVFMETMKDYLDLDFLKDERQVILDLKESQHLLPNTIESALLKNTSIDEFIKLLCLPVLILYNSKTLTSGYIEDYKYKLIAEVGINYKFLLESLPESLKEIKVHVFLLPFDDTKVLIENFNKLLD